MKKRNWIRTLKNISYSWLWLILGAIFGASLSSMAVESAQTKTDPSRKPANIHAKLLAVSEEDASDRFQEMLKEKDFIKAQNLDFSQVLAVQAPQCKTSAGPVDAFECASQIIYYE